MEFRRVLFRSKPGHANNHMNGVARLAELGLESAYHVHYGCKPGEEAHPTIHWCTRQAEERTYHIDYCFLPEAWRGAIREVSLGS